MESQIEYEQESEDRPIGPIRGLLLACLLLFGGLLAAMGWMFIPLWLVILSVMMLLAICKRLAT